MCATCAPSWATTRPSCCRRCAAWATRCARRRPPTMARCRRRIGRRKEDAEMAARRIVRLWPRRLRWRLVAGFVLTVALLQTVLTGAERYVLQTALVGSLTENLRATVRAGL